MTNKKLLNKNQEKALGFLIKYGLNGVSEMASNKLVEHNLGLVGYSYELLGMDYKYLEDIKSAGYIGLIKASRNFNYTFNRKFSSYAVKVIKSYMIREYQKIARIESKTISLDFLISLDLIDGIKDNSFEEISQIERFWKRESKKNISIYLNEIMNVLNEKQKQTLIELYFDKKTHREIAEKRGCSKQAIASLKKTGLSKLKKTSNLLNDKTILEILIEKGIKKRK